MTPTQMDARIVRQAEAGKGCQQPLSVAVQREWPTATLCGNYNRKGASATSGDGLATAVSQDENRQTKATPSQLAGEHGWSLGAAVNHQWPTPNSAKAGNDVTLTCSGDGREKPNKLGWAVAVSLGSTRSTPTVNAAQNATAPPSQHERNTGGLSVETGSSVAAPLNPAWVAILMGFPADWTAINGPRAAVKCSDPESLPERQSA